MPDESTILITGGGQLGGENNSVTTSEIDVTPIGPKLASCSTAGGYGRKSKL